MAVVVALGTVSLSTTSTVPTFLKIKAGIFDPSGTTNLQSDVGHFMETSYGFQTELAEVAAAALHLLHRRSTTEALLLVLLALQCGAHPILIKLYMPPKVVRTTVILSQEMIKLVISLSVLTFNGFFQGVFQSWSFHGAVVSAGVPAALFVVQNYCNIMANQTLPPVTFILLNQSKIISTAWCCFLLLGQKQSHIQVMALIILVLSTLLLQKVIPVRPCISCCDFNRESEDRCALDLERQPTRQQDCLPDFSSRNSSGNAKATTGLAMGVTPALLASLISGLAGAITQKALQVHHRDPYLFNVELSTFSTIFILSSILITQLSQPIILDKPTVVADDSCHSLGPCKGGFLTGTWIPVVSNAMGAILVGLVTKHSGAVTKGFVVIIGIMISAILNQWVVRDDQGHGGLTLEEVVGGILGMASLWIYLTNPPVESMSAG